MVEYLAKIDVYKDERFSYAIKNYFNNNGKRDSVWITSQSNINYDKHGNLWIMGIGYIYRFDGEDWLSFTNKGNDDDVIIIQMTINENAVV